jgi:hypothetical protein
VYAADLPRGHRGFYHPFHLLQHSWYFRESSFVGPLHLLLSPFRILTRRQESNEEHFERVFESEIENLRKYQIHVKGELVPNGNFPSYSARTPISERRDEDYEDYEPQPEDASPKELKKDYEVGYEGIWLVSFVGDEPSPVDLNSILLPSTYYVPKNVRCFLLSSDDFDVDPTFAVQALPGLRGYEEDLKIAYANQILSDGDKDETEEMMM